MQSQESGQQNTDQPSSPARQRFAFSTYLEPRYVKLSLTALLILLFPLGFLLQVSGVGRIHDECKDSSARGIDCDDQFRPFWWATFMQLFVVIGIGIAMLVDIVRDTRIVAVAFLAMATLQLMDRAEEALDFRDVPGFDEDDSRSAAAGYIISAMANFVLLFIFGIKKIPQPTVPSFFKSATQDAATTPVETQQSRPDEYPKAPAGPQP